MKRVFLASFACLFSLGVAAYGAPFYTLSWDFEDGTVGQAYPGWVGGRIESNGPFSGAPYPKGKRLYTGDNTASWLVLPEPTNSFVFTTEVWTDAGHINGMRKAGMGYRYAANGSQAWFEGNDGGGWPNQSPAEMRFGDPMLPNPRPGTGVNQWPGGAGRLLNRSTLDGASNVGGFYLPASNFEMPQFAELELMIKYNTPDNPGTVELYYRSLNYNNPRAAAGTWLQLGWDAGAGNHWDFILSTDPNTNDYWAMDAIKLGGAAAWSQASWDNVVFQSIPEPTALSLLLLGIPLLRSRRRTISV